MSVSTTSVFARATADRGAATVYAIGALTGLVVAIFFTTFKNLASIWILSNYRHCLLIGPIAFAILWDRRSALASAPVAPSWLGVAAIAGVTLLWHIGHAAAFQALEHVAAILAIPSLVLAVFGWSMLRAAAFPLLFMLAAVPVGEELIPFLMNATANVSVGLLQTFGVPVIREGVFVSLPGGEFQIADVCAGLNYLLVGVMLALAVSERLFATALARVVFVAFAATLFIVGNGVRACIVMAVASATQMRVFAGFDHVIFGVVFFALLLVLLLWASRKYSRPPAAPPRAAPAPLTTDTRRRAVMFGVVSAVLLALAPIMNSVQARPSVEVDGLELPMLARCTGPLAWSADWTPTLKAPDSQIAGSYQCGQIQLHVFAASYDQHEQGRELVAADNVLIPKRWWWSGSRSDGEAKLHTNRQLEINEVQMSQSGREVFAWYWYTVNGHAVRTEAGVKLRELLAAVALQPTVSRAYVIAAYGSTGDSKQLKGAVQESADALLEQR
jgi:EpsI family protein